MTRFLAASGPSFRRCAALAAAGEARAVVLVRTAERTPLEIGVRMRVDAPVRGLWATDAGAVFTACADGVVRWSDEPWAGAWQQQELDAAFDGVVGAGAVVFVWGTRRDGAQVVRRWAGRAWEAVVGPGFPARAACGGRSVWLAGADGGVARFTVDDAGAEWAAASWGARTLVAVGADGDELWAVSEGGELLRGSLDGYEVRARLPFTPAAVARWRGFTWIGCPERGVFRISDAGALTNVRADRRCVAIEARDELLCACVDVVAGSDDGERFPATGRGALG